MTAISGQKHGQDWGIFLMPRHGENIYRRKDGRWEARYIEGRKINGEAIYKSVYASSYETVKNKLKNRMAGTDDTPADSNINCTLNMEQLCVEWLGDIRISLKQSSFAKYYNTVYSHIIPPLSGVKIKTLTNIQVNAFIKEKSVIGRLDGNGGLSAKTVRDIAIILKEIIQYAVKKGYLAGFDYDFTLPKLPTKEINVLTVTEQSRLISYLHGNLDIEKIGVLLCLYTGIRIGELCALTWKDIDFDMDIIRIRKTLQRIRNVEDSAETKTIITIDFPKSETSMRDIPLPSFLKNTMKQYQAQYKADAYVLTGETKKFIEPRLYEKWFKNYLREAKIEDTKFHVLRHTFATRALEKGIDHKTLSEILGHSSAKFTMECYAHSSFDLKKSSIEKLIDYY